MVSLSLKTFALIALQLSGLVSAAPIDGLTKRAPKVVGLDFEAKLGKKLNDTVSLAESSDPDASLINEGSYYITYLNFGSDGQKIGVDVDTGSSDLWVPSSSLKSQKVAQYGSFDSSSSTSYNDLNLPFQIAYGDGTSTTGEFVTDSVSLGSDTLKDFQFAVATKSSVDVGILGVGLASLEAPVLDQYGLGYDNFPVALQKAGFIDTVQYSLYLNSPDALSGSILFGGKDLAKIDGDLVTLPHSGDANRLDVTLGSLTLQGQEISVNTPVNLDSGTTITYLSDDVYNTFVNILGGDGSTYQDLPIVDCQSSGSLSYNFDGITIDVPLANIVQDNGKGECVALFAGGGDNILGDTFLAYAYLVYDLENSAISLAKVKYTTDTNIVSL